MLTPEEWAEWMPDQPFRAVHAVLVVGCPSERDYPGSGPRCAQGGPEPLMAALGGSGDPDDGPEVPPAVLARILRDAAAAMDALAQAQEYLGPDLAVSLSDALHRWMATGAGDN